MQKVLERDVFSRTSTIVTWMLLLIMNIVSLSKNNDELISSEDMFIFYIIFNITKIIDCTCQ